MNKKTKFAILGVIALVLVTLSLTYAYWLITRTQTKENVITAGCLDISLTNEQNDISLTEQFPISDNEGKELTPYTFTVTNNCNTSVDYNVNLEVLGDKESNMDSSSIKVMLDDGTPVIVGEKLEVEATNADAYEAHLVTQGTLSAKGTATHSVRLWIDEEAPISEMNKTFSSKVSVTAGQGINSPIKEGTLAYAVASSFNGQESALYLDSDYREWELDGISSISLNYATNYYFGTDYVFDKAEGRFSLSGDIVQATIEECRSGVKNCGRYSLLSSTATQDSLGSSIKRVISFKSTINEDSSSSLLVDAKNIGIRNYFYSNLKDDEKGFATLPDDYGISYSLWGDITNNYVKFGKWSDSDASGNAGKDMFWRILRINGDGTIRLVYDGVEMVDNDTAHVATIGVSKYNEAATEADLRFTHADADGNQVDSTIKSFLDDWYEANLKTNYEKYIADSIFCNDVDIGVGINTAVSSAARERFETRTPKLICSKDEYKYTVNNKTGNGYLTNPIGLLTIDDVMMAGYSISVKENFYMFSGENYFLMSAFSLGTRNVIGLVRDNVTNVIAGVVPTAGSTMVRPVINLKADVAFTGNGTIDSPYEITSN